eukprot:COSAG04_NODE_225_length_19578_cov_17.172647_15_plen_79_part_00
MVHPSGSCVTNQPPTPSPLNKTANPMDPISGKRTQFEHNSNTIARQVGGSARRIRSPMVHHRRGQIHNISGWQPVRTL